MAVVSLNYTCSVGSIGLIVLHATRHFEHKYFTIRERVALGEIVLYWLSGKLNPADVTTKALDKAVTVAHSGVISGQAPLPIPKGCKVLFGPLENPREISGDYFHANQQGS